MKLREMIVRRELIMREDTRKYTRKRSLLPAKIVFNDKRSVFDCAVTNLSYGGAHLRVTSPIGIPDTFTLHIPHYDQRFSCWVAWSNNHELGVSFTPLDRVKGPPELRLVED